MADFAGGLPLPAACEGASNFVLIGEAGGGKSEIAINLALSLAARGDKPVHLYDLDMTKPLFRSRDQAGFLRENGVDFHYEEQFYDAPTVAGGVSRLLRDENCYTVLDVGGDYIGARSIGGYAPLLNTPGTIVWYVINPYRPWSMDLDHIDKVLGQVLGVSHVQLDRLRMIGNPNLGQETMAEDVTEGAKKLAEMIGPYKDIDFFAVRRELSGQVSGLLPAPVWPIDLRLTYEWVRE
ncbi:MAG: hypothetical protein J5967_06015 [Oscillospiraceae bacterium]|nr:hypothetical protein [Oscillospiraceae bacterium]